MKSFRIPVAGGGWVAFDASDEGVPGCVYARLTEVDGLLRITELYIDGQGQPIQQGAIRHFPIGWLEDWLSEGRSGDTLRMSGRYQGVDLSGAAARIPATPPDPQEHSILPDVFELAGRPDNLTEGFLADVAKAYRSAVARHLPPAIELARQAGDGTSLRTTQGWIYKARKRGLLEPAKHKGRIA